LRGTARPILGLMSQRYDIFFAAQIVDGFEQSTVRANLASLFKANDATLEKLFSGKPQLIKRGVDKAGAIKYKAALAKAGAVALIRAHAEGGSTATQAPAKPAQAAPEAKKPAAGSMAERLAALTAEPAPSAAAAEGSTAAVFNEQFSLAPVGSDVLREDEREIMEELDIDTSSIQLASAFVEPEPANREPPPPAPDTSHMSMGEVGEEIPRLEEQKELLNPDVSHLSMGEVGEDIPHLEQAVEPLNPDISDYSLAPEGSDVLEEKYRKREEVAPPSTDHLQLED